MLDKKRRIFRLIEFHINEFNSKLVETFYGKNAKLKIHSMSESLANKTLLFEVVITLGDIITENSLDEKPAHILVEEALFWFFPQHQIKTLIRWES